MQHLIAILFLYIAIAPLTQSVIIYDEYFTLVEEEREDVLLALQFKKQEYADLQRLTRRSNNMCVLYCTVYLSNVVLTAVLNQLDQNQDAEVGYFELSHLLRHLV